jgi:hypothetical protein
LRLVVPGGDRANTPGRGPGRCELYRYSGHLFPRHP